jgi:hypothetical protein
MKKIILATVLSAFGLASLGGSAVLACDGMKGHAKGDKSDQTDNQGSTAKKDSKSGTNSGQKS